MGKMTKTDLVKNMVSEKVPIDLANQYASAFLEYNEANENIEKNGSVVSHPRTANIMQNPYLRVRDTAEKRLLALRPLLGENIVEWVWKLWEFELERKNKP